MLCGALHNAHYNRTQFYEEWFSSLAAQVRFLKHTLRFPCYGDPEYTFSDVERAIQREVVDRNYLARYELRLAKAGSTIAGLMECFGTVVSVSLQHGVPLKVLCDKLSHTRFEPSGWTGNAEIGYAKSIMDYLFRWMELRFLSGKQLPLFGPDGSGDSDGRELNPDPVGGSQFLYDIGDSPPCVSCGGLMKPSGTCYTCLNCGQTSGCS